MSVFTGILPPGDGLPHTKTFVKQGHMTGDSGPPIEDPKVCFPLPPAVGNWHISAVDGVVQSETWVAD